MPDDARVVGVVLDELGGISKFVVEQEDHSISELSLPSGGSPGSSVVRAFPFEFDTPNLLTGTEVFTPEVGDVLLDFWFEIATPWNGTTPTADVGMFNGETNGFLINTGVAFDLSTDADADYGGYLQGQGLGGQLAINGLNFPDGPAYRTIMRFTEANPVKLVVSQNGHNNGANPGSTAGAATLYLITATPVS